MNDDLEMLVRECLTRTKYFNVSIHRDAEGREVSARLQALGITANFVWAPGWHLTTATVDFRPVTTTQLLAAIEATP